MAVLDALKRFRKKTLNDAETVQINTETEHDTTISQQYTKKMSVLESPDFFAPVESPMYTEHNGERIDIVGKKAILNGVSIK